MEFVRFFSQLSEHLLQPLAVFVRQVAKLFREIARIDRGQAPFQCARQSTNDLIKRGSRAIGRRCVLGGRNDGVGIEGSRPQRFVIAR